MFFSICTTGTYHLEFNNWVTKIYNYSASICLNLFCKIYFLFEIYLKNNFKMEINFGSASRICCYQAVTSITLKDFFLNATSQSASNNIIKRICFSKKQNAPKTHFVVSNIYQFLFVFGN